VQQSGGLIDRIVLTPVDGILKRELYGDLAGIARFTEAQKRKTKNAASAAEPALLSVVAGDRNHHNLLFRAVA
jgi:hypothetical protein